MSVLRNAYAVKTAKEVQFDKDKLCVSGQYLPFADG